MSKNSIFRLALIFFISAFSSPTTSSPYPDAGTLYREFKDDSFGKQPAKRKSDSLPQSQQAATAPVQDKQAEQLLFVSGFQVHGNTQLSAQRIQQTLEAFTNKELNSTQIHQAADTLRQAYIDAGLFAAKVQIPTQSVEKGVVVLYVYEGYLAHGGVHTTNTENRITNETLHEILQQQIKPGTLIRSEEFERGILLVDDLPGVSAYSTLYPGETVGTANFLLQTIDEPLISGSVDIDNFGNYFTGEARLGATLYVDSPSKVGDQVTARLVTSGTRSNYLFLEYDRPLGGNGLYLGASIDYLDYTLGKEFKSFDSEGDASEIQAFARYPFIRSRHTNLLGTARIFHLALEDANNTDFSSERSIYGGRFHVQGDHDDDMWASGVTYYYATLTLGDVSIDGNDLYQSFDEQFVKTEGSFAKLDYQLSRLQHISGSLSGYVALSGQFANSNLDTSQKFYIGGPYSVPGYPVGEASGDEATLLYGDLRYDFFDVLGQGNLQVAAFYSYGETKIYHQTWPGWQGSNPKITNKITLKSFGVSAHQSWQDKFLIRLIAGKQIGDNAGSNPITGEDSDYSSESYRVWLQGIYYFEGAAL